MVSSPRSQIVRVAFTLAAALFASVGTAVIAAVFLAIVDLYLAGHNLLHIRDPLGAPVHYSLADLLLMAVTLVAAVGAGAIAWRTGKS